VANYTVKQIDEMDAAFGGAFKRARAELGVESFGMQIIDLPPNLDQFPEHDHTESGQEEVYLLLRGAADVEVDGERISLDPETMVKVDAEAKRKLYTGSEPARILALGGVPGEVYEAPDLTQIGAPDQLPPQVQQQA
jgi:uncharacterized cupin superfamily protein